MLETQLSSMEFELAGASPAPIERISHDGGTQPALMCRVNPELVRSTGNRHERDSRQALLHRNLLPVRSPDFAVNRVIDLMRTIFDIDSKRELDRPSLTPDFSVEQSDVPLPRLTPLKLHRESAMRFGISRHNQEA